MHPNVSPHLPRPRVARPVAALAALGAAAAALLAAALPLEGQSEEPALPAERLVITVEAQESEVYRIGIPDLLGLAPHGHDAGEILRRDFSLMPGYRVIGPASLSHDLAAEGLTIQPTVWSALNAAGVIKGEVTPGPGAPGSISVRLRFFRTSSAAPALDAAWVGAPEGLRPFLHGFANDVLAELTGRPGPFGTRIAFARREGPGKKDVWSADMDGHGLRRITGEGTPHVVRAPRARQGDAVPAVEQTISMLPAYDADKRLWFTQLTRRGMYITHERAPGRRVIAANGLNMAPSICDGRVYFTSSRDGNSEIYASRTDGSDVVRLTNHPALDLSPACGPGGRVAFVSTRHGSPQIFVMNADGSGLRRVTFRGNHNQTPAWCPDPDVPLLAFTGRDEHYDVFTVDLGSNEYVRLTQAQGDNKDPTFSPDCRIVAFVSDRRGAPGLYLSSRLGFNQVRVVEGAAETPDWGPR